MGNLDCLPRSGAHCDTRLYSQILPFLGFAVPPLPLSKQDLAKSAKSKVRSRAQLQGHLPQLLTFGKAVMESRRPCSDWDFCLKKCRGKQSAPSPTTPLLCVQGRHNDINCLLRERTSGEGKKEGGVDSGSEKTPAEQFPMLHKLGLHRSVQFV